MKRVMTALAAAAALLVATGMLAAQQALPCKSAPKAFAIQAVVVPQENRVHIETKGLDFCTEQDAKAAVARITAVLTDEIVRMWNLRLSQQGPSAQALTSDNLEGRSFRLDGIIDAFADAFPKIEKAFEDYRNRGHLDGVKLDDKK